jgi:hypothetical protein
MVALPAFQQIFHSGQTEPPAVKVEDSLMMPIEISMETQTNVSYRATSMEAEDANCHG